MKFTSVRSRTRRGALTFACLATLLAPVSHANAPAGRYTVASGAVTDNQTGLVWQQADDGKTYTFSQAQSHCAALGGTWRVPTPNELMTIVSDSPPYLDAAAFPNAPVALVWTSAPSVHVPGNAFFVDLNDGSVYDYYGAETQFSVRCVH
jgi:Protein of unknown function (DUF1566)